MINVEYLENTKTLEVVPDTTNGELQNKILNIFHLSVYDIKCIVFRYIDKNYICGHDEMSFYSKFKTDNLIDVAILDKNSTSIISDDIDYNKLKEYFNTYLISLNDGIYSENQHLPEMITNLLEELNSSSNIEEEPSNIEGQQLGEIMISGHIFNNENMPIIPSSMLEILLRNTLINSIRTDLISTQEDVKIVTKKTDFDKIEIISVFEEDINCSICLESMTVDILKVKCGHYYHKGCGEEWFCKCSNKCPICKNEISDGIPLE